MSRQSRDHGEALERALDAYHAGLAAMSVAWVRRVGTPVKVIGRTRTDSRGRTAFAAVFDGRQGADFVGQTSAGWHICIEAKSHAGENAWSSDAVTVEQWADLLRADIDGGCQSIGLIVLSAWGAVWAIRPRELENHVKRSGRRTVRPTEVDSIGRRLVGVAWWVER